MALRLGVDLDGTIADFASAFRDVERRLFGDRSSVPPTQSEPEEREEREEGQGGEGSQDGEAPEPRDAKGALKAAVQAARERDLIWDAIRETGDFWLGLRPLEPGVVRLLHDATIKHGWETFFITQRPRTAGQTVQRQTQQWLMREGFESPSVLTLRGGRGPAAAALELDALLDDTPKNCLDVLSDSRCRPILILRTPSETSEAAARRLGIEVCKSVSGALALLEDAQFKRRTARPGFVQRLLGSLGRE
jgi:hypothetical protein